MLIEGKTGEKRQEMARVRKSKLIEVSLLLMLCGTPAARGQQAPASKPEAEAGEAAATPTKQEKIAPKTEHRFWDKENDWLFAGVGASRTLDYFSTLNLRRRGDKELLVTNDLVDDHAAFAVVEAAGTGVSIGASYLFHRYGHHKLERWTSILHIGLTTTGAVRNYCLKTAHHPMSGP